MSRAALSNLQTFSLVGRVGVVTGGAGLLGVRHAEAIARAGGTAILADIDLKRAQSTANDLADALGEHVYAVEMDVTNVESVERAQRLLSERHGQIDILVNNAANNPKVEDVDQSFSRLEAFPMQQWSDDIAVGLTGAFTCARVFGSQMAANGRGVILNISSEYGMIAPDQRLYRDESVAEDAQAVKPVSYTVVKAGLHGLTLYLSTYWATRGVRANTLTIGGVENGQTAVFVSRASEKVPLGRMAMPHEFQGALLFLCSDASSFVTGANIVVDGGKSVW